MCSSSRAAITCPVAPQYSLTTRTFTNDALTETEYGQTVGKLSTVGPQIVLPSFAFLSTPESR